MLPDNSQLYKSVEGYQKTMALYDTMLAEITVPYETVFVETKAGKTYVLCAGSVDAPPVVLWHGLGIFAPHWWQQINALAESYRVYAPDVIGSMGRSAPTRLDRKGSAYGEWVVEVLNGLQLEKAHMVGISNGVWLIIKLATVAAERISSAVLMSAAGFIPNSIKTAFRLLPVFTIGRFWSLERRAEYWVRAMGPPHQELPPYGVEIMAHFLAYFKYELAPPLLRDEELRCLDAPTYLMMGQYEYSFDPQKVIQRGRDILPHLVKAEIIPNVSHGMISDDPERINHHLLEWLGQYTE